MHRPDLTAPNYFGEIKQHWRALASATLGLGFGIGITAYTMAVFAPVILAEFGWPKSQFALLGSFGLVMLIAQPITGWATDRFGVKAVATVGAIGLPAMQFLLSFTGSDITMFFVLIVIQTMLGSATTSPVYLRLVAERFDNARGLAFSIVMTGPPLFGGIAAPLLTYYIASAGWRAGFVALAIATLIAGIAALILMPSATPQRHDEPEAGSNQKGSDFGSIIQSPAFWLLIGGMVLINLTQSLASSQNVLMLQDRGATLETAGWLVTTYAAGVIVGRFVFGLSLDRFRPHRVAALGLGLPAIGLLLLASPFNATYLLAAAMMLIGMAQGAEGDVGGYLVGRQFGLKNFSLVLALVGGSIAGGSAIGSVILSYSLDATGGFSTFLVICAGATVIGALLFLLMGRWPPAEEKGPADVF